MSKPEGADNHNKSSNKITDSTDKPLETIYSRKEREKYEKGMEGQQKPISPRSPIILKTERSVHHPYKHVSTPKPTTFRQGTDTRERKESHSSSSSHISKTGSKNTSKKRIKNSSRHSSIDREDRSKKSESSTPTDIQKIIKYDNTEAFYTPPDEEGGNYEDSTMDEDGSPGSGDLTLQFASAENSPFNSSVINAFDSAYVEANTANSASTPIIQHNNTNSADVNLINSENNNANKSNSTDNMQVKPNTGAIKKVVSQNPAKINKLVRNESGFKTLAMPSTVTAKVLNFATDA